MKFQNYKILEIYIIDTLRKDGENGITIFLIKTRASTTKNVRQKLMKLQGEIDESTILENFTTILSAVDRLSRQKVTKYVSELNSTINQLDLI